jgi:hypothetical protein
VCSGPDVGTSAVGLQHGVERAGGTRDVAVVDAAVVELAGQFLKQI